MTILQFLKHFPKRERLVLEITTSNWSFESQCSLATKQWASSVKGTLQELTVLKFQVVSANCSEKQGGELAGYEGQPCPRRSGPAGRGPGSAALGWGRRSGSGRYFMAGARRASCGGHTPSACDSSELDEARCLDHERQAETRGKAVLLSGRQAEAFLPPEQLFRPGAGARRAGSLRLGNDRGCEAYHTNPRQSSFRTCAAAGTVRDGSRRRRAAGG
ncbi:uncharacterized protein LOC124242645 [Equus quagga]|uniref:uncharacterized protein LOC124242645 n=1 Tax=Equus quagga TaxID=89248 RepID=UPI001EE2885A|nr:uncharacterized protein LOC124242645 [Equus quagga]